MARWDQLMVHHRGIAGTALSGLLGVRINASGSVVPSGTATGEEPFALVCIPGTIAAGKPVALGKRAEVVEFAGSAGGAYYAGADGAISDDNTGTLVGHCLEATRLVVEL